MFSVKVVKGNRGALKDPTSILISESTAKAYFGDADPMFKVLKIDNQQTLKVAGVYEDLPKNSTLADMAFIAPWARFASDNKLIKIKYPIPPHFVPFYVHLVHHPHL